MAETGGFHEELGRRQTVEAGSERAFGIVFACVFSVIAVWPLFSGGSARIWAAIAAAGFLVLALVLPRVLRPLNLAWHRFGLLLHKIVTPLIMGLLFYLTVTPIALIMRALGKNPLSLKFDAEAKSYWIERDPPGPEPDSMKNQF